MGLISRVSSRTYRIFIKKNSQKQQEAFDNNQAQDWGAEEAEDDIQEVQMKEVLIFNKWTVSDVRCEDISLKDYINVSGNYAKYLPHTAGRYDKIRFRKAQCPIIERLINSLMKTGRNNGKKMLTMRIVNHAFEIIHLVSGENPVQTLVSAIMNGGPREDSTRIGRAGSVKRQACDVSPLR